MSEISASHLVISGHDCRRPGTRLKRGDQVTDFRFEFILPLLHPLHLAANVIELVRQLCFELI
jgi:hypothetical protein